MASALAQTDEEARRLEQALAAMERTRDLAAKGHRLSTGIFNAAGVGDWGDAPHYSRSLAFACRVCRSDESLEAFRRVVLPIEAHAGRTQGDAVKYRIFAKWSMDTRDQMTQLANKAASLLDGEEQKALQFFRLLQDDVLIFTEEFIGPDLRELRSFIEDPGPK
jgi:hypothetical protein